MAQSDPFDTPVTLTLDDVLPAHPDPGLPPPPFGYSTWLAALLSGEPEQIDDWVFRNAKHELSMILRVAGAIQAALEERLIDEALAGRLGS
jgi:hypothetical protein